MTRPILYSFRRCPYAMRARLAISAAGIECELREILLRDKAPELLAASPKGTVPVVVDGKTLLEESLDIMHWALARNDPENWLDMPAGGDDLIARCDTDFKAALDRYKYRDSLPDRAAASGFLFDLEAHLSGSPYLFGATPKLADMAILTFVRQFAYVDKTWFDDQPWPHLARWLATFTASRRFLSIMDKHPRWQAGDPVTVFPDGADHI